MCVGGGGEFEAPLPLGSISNPQAQQEYVTILAANSVGQIQEKEKGFSKQLASMNLSIECIHHKISQISYDNFLLAMFSTEKSSLLHRQTPPPLSYFTA